MNRRSELKTARPTLRARIRETTVQAILSASEEVFADAGLHAARMDTIAAKAGVSVGTLYNHFEDREALLLGLITARRTELLGRIDASIAEATGQPLRARLRLIMGAFFAHCEAHRKFVHIVLQREVGQNQQAYARAWAGKTDTMREVFQRIDGEMKRGVKERALRPDVGDIASVVLIGMMRAFVIRDVVFEAGGAPKVDLDRMLDAFFDGVGARKVAA